MLALVQIIVRRKRFIWFTKKIVIHKFFSLEIVHDFDLEPDMHSTLFFYPKYAILYIFKIVPVLLERIRNIHRIYLLLIKIMLEKRYRR